MVMPRAFSSGAASIWSYALASPPNFALSTVVIAAVSVVLPWSTCPIVPTFTCGFVRSNLPFAISSSPDFDNPDNACEMVPMARIERATSPLPRECSTTEPHGHRHGPGHRDIQACGDQLRRLEREAGIEPASLAWKAKVLPLNYSRADSPRVAWWRRLDSNQRRRKPTDLQSAPFSHSGTPPRRTCDYITVWCRFRRASLSSAGRSSRQSSGRQPRLDRREEARAWPKCPQPTKGSGARVADSGDGWLHCSTRCRRPGSATSAALACACAPQSMNTLGRGCSAQLQTLSCQ